MKLVAPLTAEHLSDYNGLVSIKYMTGNILYLSKKSIKYMTETSCTINGGTLNWL